MYQLYPRHSLYTVFFALKREGRLDFHWKSAAQS